MKNINYNSHKVQSLDKDNKPIINDKGESVTHFAKYKDAAERNSAKRKRKEISKTTKRARFCRVKGNSPCLCKAEWPLNDSVVVRRGKRKKYKFCCR